MIKVNGGDESRDWEGEVDGEVEPGLGYRKSHVETYHVVS